MGEKKVIVREIEIVDAAKLSNLIQQVDASSEYMLWEAGEREVNHEQQEKMIERMKASNNSTIFVAESKGHEIVGYLFAIGGNAKRNKHSAYIVVGISEAYRGQGIGAQLFKGLEQWAIQHGIYRLELTVIKHNEAGLHLYKKMGFEVEGTKRRSLLINNEFVDEYYMSKLLF